MVVRSPWPSMISHCQTMNAQAEAGMKEEVLEDAESDMIDIVGDGDEDLPLPSSTVGSETELVSPSDFAKSPSFGKPLPRGSSPLPLPLPTTFRTGSLPVSIGAPLQGSQNLQYLGSPPVPFVLDRRGVQGIVGGVRGSPPMPLSLPTPVRPVAPPVSLGPSFQGSQNMHSLGSSPMTFLSDHRGVQGAVGGMLIPGVGSARRRQFVKPWPGQHFASLELPQSAQRHLRTYTIAPSSTIRESESSQIVNPSRMPNLNLPNATAAAHMPVLTNTQENTERRPSKMRRVEARTADALPVRVKEEVEAGHYLKESTEKEMSGSGGLLGRSRSGSGDEASMGSSGRPATMVDDNVDGPQDHSKETESSVVIDQEQGKDQIEMLGYYFVKDDKKDGTWKGEWHSSLDPKVRSSFNYRPTYEGFLFKSSDKYNERCAVCGSEDPTNFIFCDLCDMGYHCECIGIKEIPKGKFFCKSCCNARDRFGNVPPSRQWKGTFKLQTAAAGVQRIKEAFRLKFEYVQDEPTECEEGRKIGTIVGHGHNQFGVFDIEGELLKIESAQTAEPGEALFLIKCTKTYQPQSSKPERRSFRSINAQSREIDTVGSTLKDVDESAADRGDLADDEAQPLRILTKMSEQHKSPHLSPSTAFQYAESAPKSASDSDRREYMCSINPKTEEGGIRMITTQYKQDVIKNVLFVTDMDCYFHAPPKGVVEIPDRVLSIWTHIAQSSLSDRLHWVSEVPRVPLHCLYLAHDPSYIAKVLRIASRVGAVAIHVESEEERPDGDTYMSVTGGGSSYHAALKAAGSVCFAVDQILQGKFLSSFCCVRPPGHHAGRHGEPKGCLGEDNGAGQGFCILNNVAIGALHAAVHLGKRVAIVDIDVHHGNGTEEIVRHHLRSRNRSDILFTSIQSDDLYPWTSASSVASPQPASNLSNPTLVSVRGASNSSSSSSSSPSSSSSSSTTNPPSFSSSSSTSSTIATTSSSSPSSLAYSSSALSVPSSSVSSAPASSSTEGTSVSKPNSPHANRTLGASSDNTLASGSSSLDNAPNLTAAQSSSVAVAVSVASTADVDSSAPSPRPPAKPLRSSSSSAGSRAVPSLSLGPPALSSPLPTGETPGLAAAPARSFSVSSTSNNSVNPYHDPAATRSAPLRSPGRNEGQPRCGEGCEREGGDASRCGVHSSKMDASSTSGKTVAKPRSSAFPSSAGSSSHFTQEAPNARDSISTKTTKQKLVVNAFLPTKSSSQKWRLCFREKVLPALTSFQPDLILLSAGYDAHKLDPLGGQRMDLSASDYYWATNQLVSFCEKTQARVVAVLEGGYNVKVLGQCVEETVRALVEQRANSTASKEH